jgi:CheY-like chemotaxis protein
LEGIFKEIIFVNNGKDAIEICRDNPDLDLVLMDIKIPLINGYDATKEIRKFNKDLLIIAQTAYSMHGDREKAIEVGCNDYISKPINKIFLLEMIKKLLDS